jgi:hypothetical protein
MKRMSFKKVVCALFLIVVCVSSIQAQGKYKQFKRYHEELAAVQLKGKWGFIDKAGNEVIPLKYKEVMDFSEGLAAVSLKRRCGFIDKAGNEVIPLKFFNVRSFKEGFAAVNYSIMEYGHWGFINKSGQELLSRKYTEVRDFSEGLAAVVSGIPGTFNFIDTTGNEVIQGKYVSVENFSGGITMVSKFEGTFKGNINYWIDKQGNEYATKEEAEAAVKTNSK